MDSKKVLPYILGPFLLAGSAIAVASQGGAWRNAQKMSCGQTATAHNIQALVKEAETTGVLDVSLSQHPKEAQAVLTQLSQVMQGGAAKANIQVVKLCGKHSKQAAVLGLVKAMGGKGLQFAGSWQGGGKAWTHFFSAATKNAQGSQLPAIGAAGVKSQFNIAATEAYTQYVKTSGSHYFAAPVNTQNAQAVAAGLNALGAQVTNTTLSESRHMSPNAAQQINQALRNISQPVNWVSSGSLSNAETTTGSGTQSGQKNVPSGAISSGAISGATGEGGGISITAVTSSNAAKVAKEIAGNTGGIHLYTIGGSVSGATLTSILDNSHSTDNRFTFSGVPTDSEVTQIYNAYQKGTIGNVTFTNPKAVTKLRKAGVHFQPSGNGGANLVPPSVSSGGFGGGTTAPTRLNGPGIGGVARFPMAGPPPGATAAPPGAANPRPMMGAPPPPGAACGC